MGGSSAAPGRFRLERRPYPFFAGSRQCCCSNRRQCFFVERSRQCCCSRPSPVPPLREEPSVLLLETAASAAARGAAPRFFFARGRQCFLFARSRQHCCYKRRQPHLIVKIIGCASRRATVTSASLLLIADALLLRRPARSSARFLPTVFFKSSLKSLFVYSSTEERKFFYVFIFCCFLFAYRAVAPSPSHCAAQASRVSISPTK